MRTLWLLLAILISAGHASAQASDSLRRAADRAARDYEMALRTHAPFLGGGGAPSCDEWVGRFCLTYEAGRTRLQFPPESKYVTQARARAIETHRALGAATADSIHAGALVRLLLEADSARAALTVARSVSGSWGDLLRGVAHASLGAADSAEHAFDRALPQLDSVEAERATTLVPLLDYSERARYKRLGVGARREYDARFWRLADPLILTPGNESRAQHLLRYVWSRILQHAPGVPGTTSWGWDVEELLRRYGPPYRMTRGIRGSTAMGAPPNITDHFEPEQLPYAAPAMSRAALTPFTPGSAWPYDTLQARSGFTPVGSRAMSVLDHQPARTFAGGRTALQVTARFALDSLAGSRPTRVVFGLFVFDSAMRVIAEKRDSVPVRDRSVTATLLAALPDGAWAYSIEAREPGSGLAARGRHLLPPAAMRSISDPILRTPVGDPLPSLIIRDADSTAVSLGVRGLVTDEQDQVRYRIRMRFADDPGLVRRTARRLGLGSGRAEVSWTETGPARAVVPISFTLAGLQLRAGRHILRFEVEDLFSGARHTAQREVLIR